MYTRNKTKASTSREKHFLKEPTTEQILQQHAKLAGVSLPEWKHRMKYFRNQTRLIGVPNDHDDRD